MTRTTWAIALSLAALGCSGNDKDGDTTPPTPILDTGDSVADLDGTLEEANDLTGETFEELQVYQLAADAINPSGDRDFYALTLEENVPYFFWTEGYNPSTDQVRVDTVLRIYDEAGTMLAENDDMVFRYRETDSAIFFLPPSDGTFYVEVLDYGDWSGGDADGGSTATYDLFAVIASITEREGGNDTLAQARPPAAREALEDDGGDDTGTADTDTDTPADTATDSGSGSGDSGTTPSDDGWDTGLSDIGSEFFGSTVSTYAIDFYGRIDTEGDVDFYHAEIIAGDDAPDEEWRFLTVSMWPGAYGDLAPKMSLWNNAGDLLASTEDVEPGVNGLWFDDVGALTKVDLGGHYYISVEDTSGTFGPDTFYPGIRFSYLPGLAELEAEPNDINDDANPFAYEASTQTDGLFLGGMWGNLNADDPADVFRIVDNEIGGVADLYLNVFVKSAEVGSQLDPAIAVVNEAGDTLVEFSIDSEIDDSPDPAIRDYQIAEDGDLYIIVTADASGDAPEAHQYILGSYLFDEPLFQ